MIVLDASAAIEAIAATSPSEDLLTLLDGDIHAPHHLDVEVLSVLRSLERGKLLSPAEAQQARTDFADFAIIRHDILPLSERAWQMRHQVTAYYGCYLALAEALDAPLVTCDRKLNTDAHGARVILMESSSLH